MVANERSLRILHLLRAPVGGLFRHVMDLAGEQAARGHQVGIIADSVTGNDHTARRFSQIAPALALGVTRFPMHRLPHPSDFAALANVYGAVNSLKPDVVHGHGSKGGFYARSIGFMPGLKRAARVYTPHGGSFHQQPGRQIYMMVERIVATRTDLLLFESDFIAGQYGEWVGKTSALRRIAKNGLRPEEFEPVAAREDAAEFLYIGELSAYKGVDTLIDALAIIHAETELRPRLVVVGAGAELDTLVFRVDRYELNRHVAFYGGMPAREAFTLGKVMVAPSRAESLPYIVMESIAAGKPIVATDVGGVGEIFGPFRDQLIPRDDAKALARAMIAALRRPGEEQAADSARLAAYVAENFSLAALVDQGLAAYREALARLGAA